MQCTDAVVVISMDLLSFTMQVVSLFFVPLARISTKEAELTEVSPFIYFVQQSTSLSGKIQTQG